MGLTLAITLCYYMGWFWPLVAMTIPAGGTGHLLFPGQIWLHSGTAGKNQHLAEASSAVQAVSIIAILAGTITFTVMLQAVVPDWRKEQWSDPRVAGTRRLDAGGKYGL